jgi:hypothetical protein
MAEPVFFPENPGLIRWANGGAVLKRHSQASLRMLSQNISPLGEPSATLCPSLFPSQSSRAEREKAGPLAERESDVFSQFRASLLAKGFENSAPA